MKRNKKLEIFFCFSDNCIWVGGGKFSKSRKRYLSLAVNVLTNTPKIWHINKRNIFQISPNKSDEKIW